MIIKRNTMRETVNDDAEAILWIADVLKSKPENVRRLCETIRLTPCELYERVTAELKDKGAGLSYR
jgi:hypothetical protein